MADRFDMYTQPIVDEAARRGIRASRLAGMSSAFAMLELGDHREFIHQATSDRIGKVSFQVLFNKAASLSLLQAEGFPVAPTLCTDSPKIAAAFLEVHGRVVVKPPLGTGGKAVRVDIADPEALKSAFAAVAATSKRGEVLVQRQADGEDHRVLVIGGERVFGVRRRSAHVVGDGVNSVSALIAAWNETITVDNRRIRADADVVEHLRQGGMNLESVPASGATVLLRSRANAHLGGTVEDTTDELCDDVVALARQIARRFDAPLLGIDLVCRDIRTEVGAIIELNPHAGLSIHLQPTRGQARDVAGALVDLLFPETKRSELRIGRIGFEAQTRILVDPRYLVFDPTSKKLGTELDASLCQLRTLLPTGWRWVADPSSGSIYLEDDEDVLPGNEDLFLTDHHTRYPDSLGYRTYWTYPGNKRVAFQLEAVSEPLQRSYGDRRLRHDVAGLFQHSLAELLDRGIARVYPPETDKQMEVGTQVNLELHRDDWEGPGLLRRLAFIGLGLWALMRLREQLPLPEHQVDLLHFFHDLSRDKTPLKYDLITNIARLLDPAVQGEVSWSWVRQVLSSPAHIALLTQCFDNNFCTFYVHGFVELSAEELGVLSLEEFGRLRELNIDSPMLDLLAGVECPHDPLMDKYYRLAFLRNSLGALLDLDTLGAGLRTAILGEAGPDTAISLPLFHPRKNLDQHATYVELRGVKALQTQSERYARHYYRVNATHPVRVIYPDFLWTMGEDLAALLDVALEVGEAFDRRYLGSEEPPGDELLGFIAPLIGRAAEARPPTPPVFTKRSTHERIRDAARQRGLTVRELAMYELAEISDGDRRALLFRVSTDRCGAATTHISYSKGLTIDLLKLLGFPVPETWTSQELEPLEAALTKHGGQWVVKPSGGSGGRQLAANITDLPGLRAAFDEAKGRGSYVVLQRQIQGHSYRLTVVGGRVFALLREPGRAGFGKLNRRSGAKISEVAVGAPLRDLALAVATRIGLDPIAVDIVASGPDAEGVVVGLDSNPDLEEHGDEAIAHLIDHLFDPRPARVVGPVGEGVPWSAEGQESAMYAESIVLEARERGLTALGSDAVGPTWALLTDGARVEPIRRTMTDQLGIGAFNLARSKMATHQILESCEYPVAPSRWIATHTEALDWLEQHGSLVVKPFDGSGGKGVTVAIRSARQLAAAVKLALRHNLLPLKKVVVQPHLPGDDCRVLVVDGQFVCATQRLRVWVIGDGEATVRRLIERWNASLDVVNRRIRMGAGVKRVLKAQGYKLRDVPPAGKVVRLGELSNAQQGGICVDKTDQICAETRSLTESIARDLDLPVVGVDFLSPDITAEPGHILEINVSPALNIHEQPTSGKPRWPAAPLVDLLF